MTLKDLVLKALEGIDVEDLLNEDAATAKEKNEDAARILEEKRRKDRERQQRHRANKKETEAKEEPAMNEPEEDYAAKYADKSAVELFKLCKARKMSTVEQRKPQKYYIDMLVEQDHKEAAAKAEQEALEDDGWGEDEEEAEEKPAKKSPAKKASKTAKKADPEPAEDDDDGEWEI